MRRPLSIDARALAMGFAIFGNVAIALASFPMMSFVLAFHGLGNTHVESIRLTQAAYVAVYFSLLPVAAWLIARWLPMTPLALTVDPFYDDAASTIQFMTAIVIVALTTFGLVVRLAGLGLEGDASRLTQSYDITLGIIYMILLSDGRKSSATLRIADIAVVLALVGMCIIFLKRELIVLVIPLLLQQNRRRVRPIWIIGLLSAGAAIVGASMVIRGDLNVVVTLFRVLGNQFKYLERYSLDFGSYGHCFGTATLMAFTNPGRYEEFYNLINDPLVVANGIRGFRWDSSNLLERINYAYCSVETSLALYFLFIGILLLLWRKLDDIRYFRVALMTVMGAYAGFAFFNVPLVSGLVLLFVSGFWRIGRNIFARGTIPAGGIAGPAD